MGGGCYYWGVVTIPGSLLSGPLLSGGRYYRASLLSGARYFRGLVTIRWWLQSVVTIGGSLLSGACFYRGLVTIRWLLQSVVTIGGSLLSRSRKRKISKLTYKLDAASGWTGTCSFVLEVPLFYLPPSIIYSAPFDWIVQRTY